MDKQIENTELDLNEILRVRREKLDNLKLREKILLT